MSEIENLPKELVDEIRTTFKIFDQDDDGKITTKELGTVLRSLGQNPTDGELQELINQVDYNRNGVIEFDEFVDLMMRDYAKVDHESEISHAFRQFSPDINFTIPIKEVIDTLEIIGIRESEIRQFETECSTDTNRLARRDFLEMIHRQNVKE
ncbi:Oidioi.mRNA.OKI2018_I69.chr2.g4884.t1.cds [Oikopleura dioica]|uniref:Oidioi.mRNA.OKI2018_I69.chr2.g4884.t1.cds n=1 Tax=Oikopleura dioica TaxID=34765 RepID=A0ABN7T4A1_OIKDI|nr:Oidioi.mRNA.OKI2018_I69.chr2.g4884.t1.cds [Oikopleura dioica]